MQQANRVLISDYEKQFTEALNDFFTVQEKAALAIDVHYATLWRDMKTGVLSGGKRMRPKMAIMAYCAFGGRNAEEIIPVAVALELLHQFLLVHDDIIDRDTIRHGVLNVQGRYHQHYRPLIADKSERQHFAKSAAILAGDLLHGAAHTILATSALPPDQLRKLQAAFGQAVFEVGGGELLDTESVFRNHDEINTTAIAKYKTASYSFVAPLVIGAIAAKADHATCAALNVFAEDLGIAFQLRDDLLGVFGDEATTGKSSDGDIREGKYTELIARFRKKATPEQQAIYKEVFANKNASDAQVIALKDAIKASGAQAEIEELIQEYEHRAHKALDFLKLSSEDHAQFRALIQKAVRRQK